MSDDKTGDGNGLSVAEAAFKAATAKRQGVVDERTRSEFHPDNFRITPEETRAATAAKYKRHAEAVKAQRPSTTVTQQELDAERQMQSASAPSTLVLLRLAKIQAVATLLASQVDQTVRMREQAARLNGGDTRMVDDALVIVNAIFEQVCE